MRVIFLLQFLVFGKDNDDIKVQEMLRKRNDTWYIKNRAPVIELFKSCMGWNVYTDVIAFC